MKIYKSEEGEILFSSKEFAKEVLDKMALSDMEAQTADMAFEKHVPVVEIDGENLHVVVGSTPHPMLENHYITHIIVELENGFMVKELKPFEEPKADFKISTNDKVLAVYEYCNVHGLWKNEL